VDANIYVKCEWFSPTGSLKDRIYLRMMEKAEKDGKLKKGMTILECSTGNAGISCAFVSAVKGYKCCIVMPEGMSDERKSMIRAYGAELILTPGGEADVDIALQEMESLKYSDPEKYFVPGQFTNQQNMLAHYYTSGPEIWEQTHGLVDAYVATQGTGGQITGIGKYLREKNKNIMLFAVEPEECKLLSNKEWGPHKIEGIGDGFIPEVFDISQLNGIVTVHSDEAIDMAKRLSMKEGVFCGLSSGANVVACIRVAKRFPDLRHIVTFINDTGQRYFSTELCGEKAKHIESPKEVHHIDRSSMEKLEKYRSGWIIIRSEKRTQGKKVVCKEE
jgi:cysteine synthase A